MHANITLRSPWRIPAAAAAAVTVAIHVSQFGSTWQENAFAGAIAIRPGRLTVRGLRGGPVSLDG